MDCFVASLLGRKWVSSNVRFRSSCREYSLVFIQGGSAPPSPVRTRNDELRHLIQLSNSDGDASHHPRGTTCPSLAGLRPSHGVEGAGKAGCRSHPWAPCN